MDTGKKTEIAKGSTGNITLYAKWTTMADNVVAAIGSLSGEGPHNITVTGAITNDTISAIKAALQNNGNAKVSLDLSQTTGLDSIGKYAFSYCSSLTNMAIPNSIISIGDSAFYSCTNLTSMTIPASVTSIGNEAFRTYTSLTELTVSEDNSTYKSDGNCIYTKDRKSLIAVAGGLTSVTILDGITSIGGSAFFDCTSLTSVNIPNTVTSIGEYAFFGCSSLTSISIPDGITSIGRLTFADCSNLTSVTIPKEVISIGNSAFSGCRNLTIVNYKGSEDLWSTISIGDDNNRLKNATVNCNYTGE